MKIFQEIIVFLVVVSLIVGPIFNIFTLRPKSVEAGDVFGSIMEVLKEYVLDPIVWMIKDRVLKYVEQKIIDWGTGKKSDAGNPFAIGNWVDFFKQALDKASAKFVNDFGLTPLCSPLKISLGERFQFTTYYLDRPTYQTQAACTIGDIVGNVEAFYKNPQISVFGWDSWNALTKPNNNIFGSYFLAQERLDEINEQETKAADKETDVSGGYKNETVTTKTDIDACKENCEKNLSSQAAACQQQCAANFSSCMIQPNAIERNCQNARTLCYADCPSSVPGVDAATCLAKCEEKPGISIKETIKNWGSNIHESMTSALGSYMGELISAKEISELIGVLYSALLNKAVNGLGLAFNAVFSNSNQRQRASQKNNYSYQRDFQANMTPAVQKSVRGQVLSGILKSIQQLDRSQTACNEDEMMTYNEWAKSVNDVVSPNVESLYIGLEGMNLKPDYEILDSRFAPYAVFGYSYGEVPKTKIPDACRATIKQYFLEAPRNLSDSAANLAALNSTCKSIESGLEPKTPTADKIGFNASSTPCSICMYDHDALNCVPGNPARMPYPTGPTEPWSETDLALKGNFYNECKNTYNITINRCDDCLKKTDEKCGQLDDEQKNECISTVCNNYSDIMDSFVNSPPDPADFPVQGPLKFYEKCLIEEKKEACFTCLREYFVPATYCEQVNDYVARSIDKYPAVVYNNGGQIYGPADASITSKGDECATNRGGGNLALSLLCRVMPEYGGGLCRECMGHGMTEEELNDITDFRPFDTDCNQARTSGGGKDPWNPIKDGARQAKSKCCANFWVNDANVYAECAGAGTAQAQGNCTYAKPVWEEPWCYCEYGWRPLQGVHQPIQFKCPDPDGCPTDAAAGDPKWDICTNACGEKTFTAPSGAVYISTAKMITGAPNGGSLAYVSDLQNGCYDQDESNCYQLNPASLFQKLARIFKPRIPYALAAYGPCNCSYDYECNPDEYCDTTVVGNPIYDCTPTEGFIGSCTLAGTCECRTTADCPANYYCDATASEKGDCSKGEGGNPPIGMCKEGGTEGPCDYLATNPASTICSLDTPNTTDAREYCFVGTKTDPPQAMEQTCDLSGYAGQELRLGVTNDEPTGGVSGVALCIQCDPGDEGYNNGRYNTNFDQCWHKE